MKSNYLNPSSILWIMLIPFLMNCSSDPSPEQIEKWKNEISEMEQSFNDKAEKDGLSEAFSYFAAEDGVLKRGGKIIKGKEDIAAYYNENRRPEETLKWQPTYIDVSHSGDLAYTYGNFTLTYLDTLGKTKSNSGFFHTVWKRQDDGSWRYVWD